MKASSSNNTKSIRMKISLLIQHMYTLKSHDVSDTTAHSPSGLCFSALLGCELPAELKCLSKSSSLIFPFLSFFSRRVSLKSSFKSSLSTSDSCEHTSSALTLHIGFYSYIRTSNVVKMWIQKEKDMNYTHLILFSFGVLLFLSILLDLLLGPGFVLDEVLPQWRLFRFLFLLRQSFLSLLLPVFIFKPDGVCVDGLRCEVRKGLSFQFRHFGQAEESEAMRQSSKIQVCTRYTSF